MRMPKRKSEKYAISSGGDVKIQKTDTCEVDPRVRVASESSAEHDEIKHINVFQSTTAMTLDEIQEELSQPIEELAVLVRTYIPYRGFKTALEELLKKFKSSSSMIILIHGVSGIGKTSLATCLAYYLSLTGKKSYYVRMGNTKHLDHHATGETVAGKCKPDRFVIFDQCNVNAISLPRLASYLRMQNIQYPILMFTSGHYPPPAFWREDDRICFMPITINVDRDDLEQIMDKNKYPKNRVNTELLLKYTTIYGRLNECFLDRSHSQSLQTEADFENLIYDIRHAKNMTEVFLFLWPDFVQGESEEVYQEPDADNWVVPLSKVEYMGLIVTCMKDPFDFDINSVINWMELSDANSKSNGGYFELDSQTMSYSFPLARKLYSEVVITLGTASPLEIYQAYERVDNILSALGLGRDPDTNLPSVRGQIFESRIKWFCKSIKEHGLTISGGQPRRVEVNVQDVASTPDILIEKIEHHCTQLKTNSIITMWFEFNVKGAKQFPGFDFAYVEYYSETKEFNLFQLMDAAVNIHNKTSNPTLMKSLFEIRNKFGTVVKPYFLVPAWASGVSKVVEYKYTDTERNSRKKEKDVEKVYVVTMNFR